jgi:hypothetical protein
MHSEAQIPELVNLYAMASRMRVLSSPKLVGCADTAIRKIIREYSEPNKTISEVWELAQTDAVDLLREFSEAAREELQAFPTD